MTAGKTGGDLFQDLFASIDTMDTERFLGFIAEDATFRFGSAAPVKGHAAIRAAVEDFFASFAKLRHVLTRQVVDNNTVVCEGEVTYTRHDRTIITLPFANIFELDDGRISLYHIYIDISPLYDV